MRWLLIVTLVYSSFAVYAQQTPSDSSRLLEEIIIEAYETDRQLNEVPASIGYITAQDLQRFNNTSLLPAVNIVPGVRMEERSPGSYRFSIRGSSLRSPFGVRNVKAYWNGLPLTDGGGNTYLNLLDFGAIGTMEVIKGPGGSLYGAGTGGVILLKSPDIRNNHIEISQVAGNYGLRRISLGGQVRSEKISARAQFAHHVSDGFREQTALKRNAFNSDIKMPVGKKGALSATIFFTNLFYETPGGLTKEQYDADPRQARPPGFTPGAVESKAAVTNETIFGGLIYDYDWNDQWRTKTAIYGSFSAFQNPTVRNYEDRDETNLGARSTTENDFRIGESSSGKLTFGGEFQYFKSPIAVFDNEQGAPAAVQVRDELTSKLGMIFSQADFELPYNFFLTTGISLNFLQYHFVRMEPSPQLSQTRNFEALLSPRVALLKKFSEYISLYSSYSHGFSPPTLAEVRPSTNTYSNTLKPEGGNNVEIGARGSLLKGKVQYDLTLYDFKLKNTIVVRRNADDADYFVNAGETSQRGVEGSLAFEMADEQKLVSLFNVWISYAYQNYRFKDYVVLQDELSGNKLTGVAPTIFSSGVDLSLRRKFFANFTFNYVDHIPLNDANTVFADEYLLLGLKAGWKFAFTEKYFLDLFAGIDNALDQKYSLGNDLNALGGRFYNAAMPRNYYVGLNFRLAGK